MAARGKQWNFVWDGCLTWQYHHHLQFIIINNDKTCTFKCYIYNYLWFARNLSTSLELSKRLFFWYITSTESLLFIRRSFIATIRNAVPMNFQNELHFIYASNYYYQPVNTNLILGTRRAWTIIPSRHEKHFNCSSNGKW